MSALMAAMALVGANRIQLEGWTIQLVENVERDASWPSAKAELTRQLQNIKRVVPSEPLAKLQKVPIWVNVASKNTPCMAYHPGAGWLKEKGENPEMAKGVELANCKNFVSWTHEQPWMVLHELAHGYHDQFLDKGFENPSVLEAFRKAVEGKKYESVLHWDGKNTKHYALNNQMEFFAETTESYFGTNDFYPFVRAELMNFNPEAMKLMRQIWGERANR